MQCFFRRLYEFVFGKKIKCKGNDTEVTWMNKAFIILALFDTALIGAFVAIIFVL